jgi:hypothetical protein
MWCMKTSSFFFNQNYALYKAKILGQFCYPIFLTELELRNNGIWRWFLYESYW